jgi:hypothetical protein
MVAEAKPIEVPIDSETAKLLHEADEAPVVFVVGGERYLVLRESAASARPESDDPWADYDPEKAIAGMLAAAGSWRDVDAEKLKADIQRWREEGSRPPSRP